MILSVLRHTNKTVKFWFIENFLSPSFLVRRQLVCRFAELLTLVLGIHPALCRAVQLPV